MNNDQTIQFWNLWNDKFDTQGVELQALSSLVSLNGKKVLEIGCGNGRLSRLLGPLRDHLIAIDNDGLMLEAASAYANPPNIEFRAMDALNLEFDSGIFDVVILSWVLTSLQGKEMKALREAKRVLKKGGKALIVDFGNYSKYDQIVGPFIQDSDIHTVSIGEANITQLLKDIFAEPIHSVGPLKSEYRFDSKAQFRYVIQVAIKQLHHCKIDNQQKFMRHLSKYGRSYSESVIFYCVEK